MAYSKAPGWPASRPFAADLWEWRYRPSLDLSPWVDSPTTTTSLDRLDAECGEPLRELGFCKNDGDDRWWRPVWTDCRWRPVWTGYTPAQRRLIRDGTSPQPCRTRNWFESAFRALVLVLGYSSARSMRRHWGLYGQTIRQRRRHGLRRKKLVPEVARERRVGARDRQAGTLGVARRQHHRTVAPEVQRVVGKASPPADDGAATKTADPTTPSPGIRETAPCGSRGVRRWPAGEFRKQATQLRAAPISH